MAAEKNTNEGKVVETRINIYSRVNYPITLKYNSDNIMIPPNGKALDIVKELIEEELPAGLQYVSLNA